MFKELKMQRKINKRTERKFEIISELLTREFYEYYRKNRKKPSKVIDQYRYFTKAISGLLLELRKEIIKSKNGLYLQDFAYISYNGKTQKRRDKTKTILHKKIELPWRGLEFYQLFDCKDQWRIWNYSITDYIKKIEDYEPKPNEVKYLTKLRKDFFDK